MLYNGCERISNSMFAQRLRLYAVRYCGLLICPPTQKFERGRMLELPLKPLLNIAFVNGLCFVFVISFLFVSVLVRWLGSSFAKLGFGLGLSDFANVPPNALALYFFNFCYFPFVACINCSCIYSAIVCNIVFF